jgi:hypothetical protein
MPNKPNTSNFSIWEAILPGGFILSPFIVLTALLGGNIIMIFHRGYILEPWPLYGFRNEAGLINLAAIIGACVSVALFLILVCVTFYHCRDGENPEGIFILTVFGGGFLYMLIFGWYNACLHLQDNMIEIPLTLVIMIPKLVIMGIFLGAIMFIVSVVIGWLIWTPIALSLVSLAYFWSLINCVAFASVDLPQKANEAEGKKKTSP